MKQLISTLLVISIFTSCTSTNRILEINDSKNDTKGLRLIQNPKLHSAEKNGNTLVNQFFNIQTTFIFEERKSQNQIVTMELRMNKSIQTGKTDSVMFLKLNDENIRIVTSLIKPKMEEKTYPTSNQANRTEQTSTTYAVPENLWLSVANAKSIIYKLSSGKIGIEIKPGPEETAKVKEFFSKAMQRRLEIVPLVPSGKVKW